MKAKKDSMGKVGTGAAPSRPSMAGSGGKVAAVRAVASKPSMASSKPAMPGRAAGPARPPMAGAGGLLGGMAPKAGVGSGPTMSKPAGLTAQQVKNIRSMPKSVTKPMVSKPSMPGRAAAGVAPKAVAKKTAGRGR